MERRAYCPSVEKKAGATNVLRRFDAISVLSESRPKEPIPRCGCRRSAAKLPARRSGYARRSEFFGTMSEATRAGKVALAEIRANRTACPLAEAGRAAA